MRDEEFTVRDLIEKLQAVNPDARVILQGCDCVNTWDGSVDEWGPSGVILGC